MAFSTDLLTFLSSVALGIYAYAPWLVWAAVMGLATCLFLYACALVHAAWRLWRSEDERAWFRLLRQARREQHRQDWATLRQTWRTELWHRGDGPIIAMLAALAAVVIAVCR
jgi:hypothetical protein